MFHSIERVPKASTQAQLVDKHSLIMVVGGDQGDPATIVGSTPSAVCRKPMPRQFPVAQKTGKSVYKRLHSFRTASVLHA